MRNVVCNRSKKGLTYIYVWELKIHLTRARALRPCENRQEANQTAGKSPLSAFSRERRNPRGLLWKTITGHNVSAFQLSAREMQSIKATPKKRLLPVYLLCPTHCTVTAELHFLLLSPRLCEMNRWLAGSWGEEQDPSGYWSVVSTSLTKPDQAKPTPKPLTTTFFQSIIQCLGFLFYFCHSAFI